MRHRRRRRSWPAAPAALIALIALRLRQRPFRHALPRQAKPAPAGAAVVQRCSRSSTLPVSRDTVITAVASGYSTSPEGARMGTLMPSALAVPS